MLTAIQIDWSEAPVDATHYWDGLTKLWYKIEENQPIWSCAIGSPTWFQSSFTEQDLPKEHLYTRPTEPLFKVGDQVYCPARGVKVYTIVKNENSSSYPLKLQIATGRITLKTNGYSSTMDTCPSIFHATSENQQSLEQLYGVQFEDPNMRTGSDLTRLKLEESNTPVLGYVSNESETDTRCVTLIVKVNKKGQFISHNQSVWLYAVPYDKPIQTALL
jgi:hypothetical protein